MKGTDQYASCIISPSVFFYRVQKNEFHLLFTDKLQNHFLSVINLTKTNFLFNQIFFQIRKSGNVIQYNFHFLAFTRLTNGLYGWNQRTIMPLSTGSINGSHGANRPLLLPLQVPKAIASIAG